MFRQAKVSTALSARRYLRWTFMALAAVLLLLAVGLIGLIAIAPRSALYAVESKSDAFVIDTNRRIFWLVGDALSVPGALTGSCAKASAILSIDPDVSLRISLTAEGQIRLVVPNAKDGKRQVRLIENDETSKCSPCDSKDAPTRPCTVVLRASRKDEARTPLYLPFAGSLIAGDVPSSAVEGGVNAYLKTATISIFERSLLGGDRYLAGPETNVGMGNRIRVVSDKPAADSPTVPNGELAGARPTGVGQGILSIAFVSNEPPAMSASFAAVGKGVEVSKGGALGFMVTSTPLKRFIYDPTTQAVIVLLTLAATAFAPLLGFLSQAPAAADA